MTALLVCVGWGCGVVYIAALRVCQGKELTADEKMEKRRLRKETASILKRHLAEQTRCMSSMARWMEGWMDRLMLACALCVYVCQVGCQEQQACSEYRAF